MFGQGGGGGRLSKSPKTNKWAPVHYLQFTKAMEIYCTCICMFYLNEQTDCPILTGIHKVYTYNAYRYTVQNMYINI